MRYRRVRIPGATYFFTVVTYRRAKLLQGSFAVNLFNAAVAKVQERHPFRVEAAVVLPDHIHAIWSLPEGDSDYPKQWRLIKEAFTRAWHRHPSAKFANGFRSDNGEPAIWQARYWEHLIRDERDLAAHVEYIHFNPVKHGFVKAPKDRPHSTFRDWVEMGLCDPD